MGKAPRCSGTAGLRPPSPPERPGRSAQPALRFAHPEEENCSGRNEGKGAKTPRRGEGTRAGGEKAQEGGNGTGSFGLPRTDASIPDPLAKALVRRTAPQAPSMSWLRAVNSSR